jgi:Fe2+ transport system protein FeoA
MMEIPLAMLPVGAKGKITRLHGGRGLVRRLSDMGFTLDVEVKVVHSHASRHHSHHHHHHSHGPVHGGPLVVEVKDSRIALGRGVAMKIMVQEVDN